MKEDLHYFIKTALAEDIGVGDITTLATISNKINGTAIFYVKENCVIAGIEIAKLICQEADPLIECTFIVEDGAEIQSYQEIGQLYGPVTSILKVERLVLNCMQRMSAIATKTRKLSALVNPYGIMIADTRKTTPNFRICEKLAVKIGGGYNHRFGLYDAILIKDNHIQANGGIENTLNICRDYILHHQINLPIIVEVKNLSEFNLAKQFEMIDRILLDNFSPAEINETLPHNSTHKKIEISGGITEENIHEYLIKGIDLISMGDLTHHVSSVDISLKII